MRASGTMRRGGVWLAELPPPDRTRPVVLVSRDEAYAIRRHVTVAAITTRRRNPPTQVPVGVTHGLTRDSVVNCDLLFTLDRELLIDHVGDLGTGQLREVDEALKLALGLD